MRIKLFSIIALTSAIVIGLTSCSRDYHLEYAGRYHPNKNIEHSPTTNASAINPDQMSELPANESLTASTNDEAPLVAETIIVTHPSEHYTFNPGQQKKADKILQLMDKKAGQNNVGSKSFAVQSKTNSHSTTVINESYRDDDRILYFLLAILLPPLAVFLWEDGITVNFWLDCLFTLLFWIPGIIFAWIVILGKERG